MNNTNDNALKPGTLLRGKSYTYTIQKDLGQGTFGITYLATTQVKITGALGEIDTSIQVAIKEFFMSDINGREDNTVTSGSKGGVYDKYKQKFAREAENLSKLHHPHIVKVLEYFEANNTVYYAMEFVEGGNLNEYIGQKNGLPETECVKYTRQIGSALSYMHAHKMLHLDLKPGNVMLRKNGDAVLIDFGLSKQYDETGKPETSTSVGGGTPGYAPIEQANYHDGKGFPVTMDVYALGATMYKMLTGERPPEASDILNDGFPTYKLQEHQVSDKMIAHVTKAMAPMKKDRPQSVEEFLKELGGGKTASNGDNEGTDYEIFPVKERITLPHSTHELSFSFSESSHPKFHHFKAKFSPTSLSIQAYVEYELVKSREYTFDKTRFEALLAAINSLKLYKVAEVDSRGFTGGETISLQVGEWDVYHYGTKSEHFGTLSGDVYPLLDKIKEAIPDFPNLWTKDSVWDKYKIPLIGGGIACVLAIVLMVFLNTGNKPSPAQTPPQVNTESASPKFNTNAGTSQPAAVESIADKPDEQTEGKQGTSEEARKPASTTTPAKKTQATPTQTTQRQSASQTTLKEEVVKDDKIYETVDQMPGYPNGMAGIMQYLSENVRYPATAQENGIQGRVLVRFVINTDGSVTDAKVIRSVDPDLDKEAVRVVSSMTKWRPGKLNGKAVRVAYTLPIMFRLE